MTVRLLRVLRGPNIWAMFPVLEAWVDLGDLADRPPAEIPGFRDRLTAWLTTLSQSRRDWGNRGRPPRLPGPDAGLADVLAHVALELEALDGSDFAFARARATSEPGVFRIAVPYQHEDFGRPCLEAAVELCRAAMDDRPYDILTATEALYQRAAKLNRRPHLAAFADAARARGIPFQQLGTSEIGTVVVFGQGARQRRIISARTDRTGAIAESISGDKALTKAMLRSVGVPVAEGEKVATVEEAWGAASEIGLPVVIKPYDTDYGIGVGLNLSTREQVIAAFETARRGPTTSWSSARCRATSTACWSSTAASSRPSGAIRRGSSATAWRPSPSSWSGSMLTPCGATATRRRWPASRSTRPSWRRSPSRA